MSIGLFFYEGTLGVLSGACLVEAGYYQLKATKATGEQRIKYASRAKTLYGIAGLCNVLAFVSPWFMNEMVGKPDLGSILLGLGMGTGLGAILRQNKISKCSV